MASSSVAKRSAVGVNRENFAVLNSEKCPKYWAGSPIGCSRSIESLAIGMSDLSQNSTFAGMSALFVNNSNLCRVSFNYCEIGDDNTRLLASSLMKRHNTHNH